MTKGLNNSSSRFVLITSLLGDNAKPSVWRGFLLLSYFLTSLDTKLIIKCTCIRIFALEYKQYKLLQHSNHKVRELRRSAENYRAVDYYCKAQRHTV